MTDETTRVDALDASNAAQNPAPTLDETGVRLRLTPVESDANDEIADV